MSDLREQCVEAMAQALWRDQFPAVTRVPGAPHEPPEWDYEFMDVAEAALDALLDVLGEHIGDFTTTANGYPTVYEVAPSALPHLEALGLLGHFGRVPPEFIVSTTLTDALAVLRTPVGPRREP